MMKDAILQFPAQFTYDPKIENEDVFSAVNSAVNSAQKSGAKKFIACGMGGSQLAADLLKAWDPALDIISHKDYDLPALPEDELKSRLIILSSYSGNTEETISSFHAGLKMGLPMVAISTGGALLDLAQSNHVPFIRLPATGIQPRCAMGLNIKALLKVMGKDETIAEVTALSKSLNAQEFEETGKALAAKLKGFIPIVYASSRNYPLAYNWKIKLNETGKTPAFCNMLPELNHNEMNSFDKVSVPSKFSFVFLRDQKLDHPRVRVRMETLKKLYEDRGFAVTILELQGQTIFYKLFSTVLVGDWTAFYTAQNYSLDPENVPMVEEFKKLLLTQ